MKSGTSMLVVLAALAVDPCWLKAGEFQDDLRGRRARVMQRLGPESILILWSAPIQTYSADVEYEYRQDSNFYYLTGIDQDESILVLMPGNETRKEILFVREKDPVREHWEGHILSRSEATAQSGIETVYLRREFEPFLDAVLSGTPYAVPRYRPSLEYARFFGALSEGKAQLALVMDAKASVSGPVPKPLEFAGKVRERFLGIGVQDASRILHELRQIKTPYERKALVTSLEISNDAQLAGMQAARPGAFEYEAEAAIEHVYKARGALGPGYPSIVASGPNATILHYTRSTRRMEPGDLLLVDAAAHYEYLTGDITRTYPVGGTFSPLQKDLYRIVLEAQQEGMKFAETGRKITDVHQKTVEVVKQGLLKLGLITDSVGDQYRTWYTHGACHFIGMDVHDVGDSKRPLEPGMAFVIEPGIYIREGVLDDLPKSPANAAFVEKVRPAYEKYKGIGIRLEDSFLMTESGLKCLSCRVPRTIEEIESFLRKREIKH